MKVLLTGAAGFIGYHVAKALLARGDSVMGIDNINDYYCTQLKHDRLKALGIDRTKLTQGAVHSTLHSGLRFMQLDCADASSMAQLFAYERFDVVCHLAAQAGVMHSFSAPHTYVDSNITGFLNILEGCRAQGIAHCVYASSSSVYGASTDYPYTTGQSATHPVSLYAATKRANELFAHSYSHNFAIATTGLRFFTVYGPWGRPDMAPMLFLERMVANKPIKVYNQGNMFRDFTYIDDIVQGVLLVLDKPAVANTQWNAASPDIDSSHAPFRLYNIGRGEPMRLTAFIDTMEQVSGMQVTRQYEPMRSGDVHTTHADVTRLTQDCGYKPTVSLHEGLSALWAWYKAYYVEQQATEGSVL